MADGLEGVVGAAIGQVAKRFDGRRAVVTGEEAVGRPEATRGVELGGRAVDRDDAAASASTAPITIERPTPPRPMTATLAPAGTAAVFWTAPTPVDTQHPMSAATAGSTPSGRGIAAASGTTVASAIVPMPQYDRIGSPSSVASTVAPSGIRCANDGESGHAHGRPARHERQRPHGTSHDSATGCPTRSDAHVRPDRVHHAGALVAHHDRGRSRPVAIADVQVRMTDAGRQDPDANLARTRLRECDRLDGRRLRTGPKDGGLDGGHDKAVSWSDRLAPATASNVARDGRMIRG